MADETISSDLTAGPGIMVMKADNLSGGGFFYSAQGNDHGKFLPVGAVTKDGGKWVMRLFKPKAESDRCENCASQRFSSRDEAIQELAHQAHLNYAQVFVGKLAEWWSKNGTLPSDYQIVEAPEKRETVHDPEPPESESAENRRIRIIGAIHMLVSQHPPGASDDADYWTQEGEPKTSALAPFLGGEEPTAAERNAAWELFTGGVPAQ